MDFHTWILLLFIKLRLFIFSNNLSKPPQIKSPFIPPHSKSPEKSKIALLRRRPFSVALRRPSPPRSSLCSSSTSHNDFQDDSDDSSDDDYEIPYYSDDESDTASLDHLSEGEDEIIDARMKKAAPTLKVNDPFLTELCDSYDRDKYVEKEVHSEDEQLNPEDEDIDGDNLPRHDPNTKWKHMHPVIGERYESPQQLKRCVIFYAIANGYKLWFKRNDYKRICVKCCKGASDEESCPFHLWASWMQKEKSFQIKTLVEEHRCSRSFDFGTLINCNWIASTYGKKIIRNPSIKLREIKEKMLKKYKCKVTKGQCERAKQKALTGDGMMESTHEVPSPTWRNGINPSDLTIPPPMTQPIYSQLPVEVPLSGSQAPVTQPPVYEDDALFDVNVFGDIPVEVQPTNGGLVDVLGDIPVTQIAANKKTKKLPIKRRCLGDRII